MKILVVHTYGLGDMIMFTPALQEIVVSYPNAVIDFVVFQKLAAEPIKKFPNLGKLYFSTFKMSSVMNVLKELRGVKYDIALTTSGTAPIKAALFLHFCRTKVRIGEFKSSWQKLFFDKPVEYEEYLHRVENNFKLIDALTLHKKRLPVSYYGIDSSVRYAKHNRQKLVVGVHAGSNPKFSFKRWKPDYFVELIELLKQNFIIDVKVFSGPGEIKESRFIAERINGEIVERESLYETAKEIATCDLFIHTDSGLGHIASCFDLEIFTIFGPAKDYKAHPWSQNTHVVKLNLPCQPCYGTDRLKRCTDFKCLNDLTPEKVFEEIREKSKVLCNAVR